MSLSLLGACASTPDEKLPHMGKVDLERFMGRWYVIANIPTFIEKDAYNAIESYQLDPDGTIATTFTFRKGGFDGEEKTYNPRGWVRDRESNAVWGMQFIWPIKAEYVIAWVDPDYTETIIGRSARDYVWIMARTPTLTDAQYAALVDRVRALGYDMAKLQRVPQQWP
jgi:apolipoprotein D and lipocalin family protein